MYSEKFAKQQKYTLNLVGNKGMIYIVDISKVRFL